MVENQETEQVTINLADSITMMPITIPARGEICTHLQCFDLETYISLNAKHKRWQCPFCNKRSSYVIIDPYFKYILNEMKPLRDKIADIDDKITLYKDLSIIFTKDKGKFEQKCDPIIENDECLGYRPACLTNGTGTVDNNTTSASNIASPICGQITGGKPNKDAAINGNNNSNNGSSGNEIPSTEASNTHTEG